MRIAHVSWLLSHAGGGIPPVVFSLAAHQRHLGVDACVLGVQDPRAEAIGEAQLARAWGPVALGFSPALKSKLRRVEADLVHLHGLFTWTSALVSGWAKTSGRPTLVSPHGMLEPWALANSPWKKRAFRWLVENRNIARAHCMHALCAAEAASLRALGVRAPIAVIPNGVDLPAPVDMPTSAFEDRRVLLFMGRLHPKKGLRNLVEAWRLLKDGRATAGWRVVIAGPDQLNHAANIRQHVRALELQDDVELVGALYGPAKQAALATAAAFVLPSFSEGFSMAVLEAMAWRLPVVISRPCNLDVEAIGAGFLCDPSAASVAEGLRSLLALSDAERAAMGRRARGEVEVRYAWPTVAARFREVYDWCLGVGQRPSTVEVG